jgi:hypothetical protein
VIFLFMHGGPSQIDTFDWKPLLHRDDGKPLPFAKPRIQFAQTAGQPHAVAVEVRATRAMRRGSANCSPTSPSTSTTSVS